MRERSNYSQIHEGQRPWLTRGRTVAAAFTYGANETISAAALEVTSRSGSVEVKRLWVEVELLRLWAQTGLQHSRGKKYFLALRNQNLLASPSHSRSFFRDICCLFYNVQQCTALSLAPRSSNRCFKLVFGPNQQDSGQPRAGYDDLGMRLNKLYFSRNL